MFVIVPGNWDSPLSLKGVVHRRQSIAAENHSAIRKSLEDGENLFLIGVEGVSQEPGFVVATDHSDLFGSSVLEGPNRDDLGPRFPSLMNLYVTPEGHWKRGIVARVPDWRLATPAELDLLGAAALVSNGIDEAEIAGHGGARVVLIVRCHGWDSVNSQMPPLLEVAKAAEELLRSKITEGGEEREL